MLLGTPQPEAGCNRKLWQEAGMSNSTDCTVICPSAQLSPGCTFVQVLRYHIMNGLSSLEPSTSCKSPWKPQGSPTELCPSTADLAEEPWELKAIQGYQSPLTAFVSLCFTHPGRSGFNHPTPPLKAFPAQMNQRWKVHQAIQ